MQPNSGIKTPPQKQIAGKIEIVFHVDGTVSTQVAGPNSVIILGMLEQAKADIVRQFQKQNEGPRIEIPRIVPSH